jgi:acyl dehydratase
MQADRGGTVATNAEAAYELFKAKEGSDDGAGEWMQITQDRINAFADVTEDHQFIHIDPEMSAQISPWKVTIAHGFLTLSLLTKLAASVPTDAAAFTGVVMGINYGFEKVRFITPVKVDSRIRATSVLKAVELKDPNNIQLTRTFTIEIEGESKPACVADWITRLVYS